MSDPFDLSDTTAVVAGGAGLIGTALCDGLADHGATVLVLDAAVERGERVARDLAGDGRFMETDVTDEASVRETFEAISEEYGRIDTFVNCSYPRNENYGRRYEDVTYADWRENVDLHLNSYFLCSQAVSRVMADGETGETGEKGQKGQKGKNGETGGSIINFGSTYGVQAPDFSVYEGTEMTSPVEYSAIKGGIVNFTRYLASYLGSAGIRANTISPGGVFDEQDPTFVENYETRTPLDRMATPEDFKGPVVFLASAASAYVTGHDLRVDGGWTIR